MEKISYKLDEFEGPLDLLLLLIAKNKFNINDIPLHELIDQYLYHINKYQENNMDIASEFLEMAARLIYMKTVSLLPKHDEIDDLKLELTTELMEYERCRTIAEKFSQMTSGFDTCIKQPDEIDFDKTYLLTHEADMLIDAYISAVGRGQRKLPPPTTIFTKIVAKKVVSVSSKIVYVLKNLLRNGKRKMNSFFKGAESRSELVATFLAMLELCKANRIEINGTGDNAEITVKNERKK